MLGRLQQPAGGGGRLSAVLGGRVREGDVLSPASGAEGAECVLCPQREEASEATQDQAWFLP